LKFLHFHDHEISFCLLIAPEGIEIVTDKTPVVAFNDLLIAPEGIEMTAIRQVYLLRLPLNRTRRN
jgi:hypothetical protein